MSFFPYCIDFLFIYLFFWCMWITEVKGPLSTRYLTHTQMNIEIEAIIFNHICTEALTPRYGQSLLTKWPGRVRLINAAALWLFLQIGKLICTTYIYIYIFINTERESLLHMVWKIIYTVMEKD